MLVTLACFLGLAAPALAGGAVAVPSAHAVRATRWILIASIALVLVLAVFPLKATRLVIGADGRWSTSKTTATIWTSLLAGSLLGIVIAKFADYPQALDQIVHSGLAGQYGLLIGGPLGAAIAAKGIVGKQVEGNPSAKAPTTKTSPAHLIQNDAGETDLGDFQYALFNLVAIVFFIGTLIESPLAGLPRIPDVILGLTSVSAVGYVAKKALPPTTPTAKLTATDGKQGASVTITGAGLLTGKEAATTPLVVLFGTQAAAVGARKRTNSTDTIEVTVPPTLPLEQAVDVLIVTPTNTLVAAGSFTRVP
jgi:hypothetical protein